MKKTYNKIILIILLLLTSISVKAYDRSPTMSSDISGLIPGSATHSTNKNIAKIDGNIGFRMYIANTKTGSLLGEPVDFAPSDYSGAKKFDRLKLNTSSSQYASLKVSSASASNIDFVHRDSFEGYVIPSAYYTNENMADLVQTFVTDLHENDLIYSFVTRYLYKDYQGDQVEFKEKFQTNYLKSDPSKECLNPSDPECVPLYYIMVEPLSLYTIFGKKIAMTPAEAAGSITRLNYGDWWAGVPLDFSSSFTVDERKSVDTVYPNMIDTPLCRSDVNAYIDRALEIVKGVYTDAEARELIAMRDAYQEKCWLGSNGKYGVLFIDNQVSNRNTQYIFHRQTHTIGSKTFLPLSGAPDSGSKSTNRERLMNTSSGLGLGFFSLSVDTTECPPSSETFNDIKLGNKTCCKTLPGFSDSTLPDQLINDVKYEDGKCNIYQEGFVSEIIGLSKDECTTKNVLVMIDDLFDNECSPVKVCPPTDRSTYTEESLKGATNCCNNEELKTWLNDSSETHFEKDSFREIFKKECETPVTGCDYKVTGEYPQCSTNPSDDWKAEGNVNDIKSWECILESPEKGDADFQDHYFEMSNSYCEVYCREDVNYLLPDRPISVLAGQHFTVGVGESHFNWEPINMTSNVECKAEKIDHEQFVKDWDKYDDQMSDYWDEYQREQVRQSAIQNPTYSRENQSECGCKYSKTTPNGKYLDCCTEVEEVVGCPENQGSSSAYGGYFLNYYLMPEKEYTDPETGVVTKLPKHCRYIFCSWSMAGAWCNTMQPVTYFPYYQYQSTVTTYECGKDDFTGKQEIFAGTPSYSGNDWRGNVWTSSISRPSWCEDDRRPNRYTEINSSKRLYNMSLSNRTRSLNEIRECATMKYELSEFRPKLSINFDEPRYSKLAIDLDMIFEDSFNTELSNGSYDRVDSNNCVEGSKCVEEENKIEYPAFSDMYHTAERIVDYKLPVDLFDNIDKFEAESSSDSFKNEQIYQGYGSLPIDFVTESGTYDISIKFDQSDGFGSGHRFNKFIIGGRSEIDVLPDGYNCCYEVENRIFPDNKTGLNLIYRPIELSNPFPGIEGTGREAGENWKGYEERVKDNVYNKDPLYTINLSLSSISQIRSYNKEADNYLDYDNLTCNNGRDCISGFIDELKTDGLMDVHRCARSFRGSCDRGSN